MRGLNTDGYTTRYQLSVVLRCPVDPLSFIWMLGDGSCDSILRSAVTVIPPAVPTLLLLQDVACPSSPCLQEFRKKRPRRICVVLDLFLYCNCAKECSVFIREFDLPAAATTPAGLSIPCLPSCVQAKQMYANDGTQTASDMGEKRMLFLCKYHRGLNPSRPSVGNEKTSTFSQRKGRAPHPSRGGVASQGGGSASQGGGPP